VRGFNRVIQEHDLPGCAYYGSSVWHMLPSAKCPYRDGCNFVDCQMDAETLYAGMGKAQGLFRLSMFNRGVDTRAVGWVSAAHSAADVAFTVDALDATLQHMKAEGAL
jgi:glutamate-1-semialdehyde aminotransferase